jgi:drug/metabolite transporter (DMT)-like permease
MTSAQALGPSQASVEQDARHLRRIWFALFVVYLVWGSTYLAIRVGVKPSHGTPIPPLLLAGARFTIGGGALLAITARRPAADGQPDPLGRQQWAAAAIIGTALLLGGNGLVSVAEQHMPSGVAALVLATIPLWAAVMGSIADRDRMTRRRGAGLLIGILGVAVLVTGHGDGPVRATSVLLVLAAACSWAVGSVWSQTAPTVRRPLVMTGMEMLSGGIATLTVAAATGETSKVDLATVSTQAWLALGYLIIFGSLAGYTAYVWLLKTAPLSLVMTYAFVNPLVAVLLGAALLHEQLAARTLLASALIVLSVAVIINSNSDRVTRQANGAGDAASPQQKPPATPSRGV